MEATQKENPSAQTDSKHGKDAYPEKSLLDQHYLDDPLQVSSVLICRAEKSEERRVRRERGGEKREKGGATIKKKGEAKRREGKDRERRKEGRIGKRKGERGRDVLTIFRGNNGISWYNKNNFRGTVGIKILK